MLWLSIRPMRMLSSAKLLVSLRPSFITNFTCRLLYCLGIFLRYNREFPTTFICSCNDCLFLTVLIINSSMICNGESIIIWLTIPFLLFFFWFLCRRIGKREGASGCCCWDWSRCWACSYARYNFFSLPPLTFTIFLCVGAAQKYRISVS